MNRKLNSIRGTAKLAAILVVFGVIAGAVLLKGVVPKEFLLAAQRPTGEARLIAIDRLPAEEASASGAMCEWEPASAAMPLRVALQEERVSARAASEADTKGTAALYKEVAARKPLRVIRDPYSAYSAVAVDATNNEVVLTDENLFNVLVYDRLANTPPSASMTEPKRQLGGLKTKIEFQCGLYIDPTSGDIYAVNNDTVDTLVIFNRQAKGDVPPSRELYTPHGTFGIAVDEAAQELFLTVQHDSAVVVFPKLSKQDDAPIRLIQGDKSRLADPHGIALDDKNGLIFVTNHGSVHQVVPEKTVNTGRVLGRSKGKDKWPVSFDNTIPGSGKMLPPSITVYRKSASGDEAPVRVIEGPKTQMNWPTGIAINPARNEIIVANDGGDSILVFDATASGDVAPLRVIKGPKSLVSNPTGVYIDSKNNELWVANFGNHTATVFPTTANGDVAPLRVIRSAPLNKPVPGMGNPHPIAYDSKREEILVPN